MTPEVSIEAFGGKNFGELYVANLARITVTQAKVGRKGQPLANQSDWFDLSDLLHKLSPIETAVQWRAHLNISTRV